MIRRILPTVAATLALLLISTSAAVAHVCFNISRTTEASARAAESPAWWTLEEFIVHEIETGFLPPLCPQGVDSVVDAIDPDGELATHAVVILAEGQLHHQRHLSGDGHGIDHVVEHPEIEDPFFQAVGEAVQLCSTG